MTVRDATLRAGLSGLARIVIESCALAGGCVLLALVLMNVESVVASALFGAPFPGDFEMTQVASPSPHFPSCPIAR